MVVTVCDSDRLGWRLSRRQLSANLRLSIQVLVEELVENLLHFHILELDFACLLARFAGKIESCEL